MFLYFIERNKIILKQREKEVEVEGIISDDIKDEMSGYIRSTMELNRMLYEITNSSNTSNDVIMVEKKNQKKKENPSAKINKEKKEMDRGIHKFTKDYEVYEDKLSVGEITNTIWETNENLSEIISVELSSIFIGNMSKKVYFMTKSIMIFASCILTSAAWAVILILYKLKSSIKRVV